MPKSIFNNMQSILPTWITQSSRMLSLAVLFMCALPSFADSDNMKTLGSWDVHFIALPSTFIQPNIAQQYGLKRSQYSGLINIAVLNHNDQTAQDVVLTGSARNLLGTSQTLTFIPVVEGDARYYLAQVDFRNEELFRFDITISQGQQQQRLQFQHKYYVD